MKKILSALAALISVSAADGKVKKPDIRFPEDVIKDSQEGIEKALKKNDNELLVEQLALLAQAKAEISINNLPSVIAQTDSLAEKTEDECLRSLLYALEARLYANVYQNDSYKYNSREKTGEEVPADIFEWSRENFLDKTVELTDKALANADALSATQTKEYKKVVKFNDIGVTFAPTLFDMTIYYSISTLRSFQMYPSFYRGNASGNKGLDINEKTDSLYRLLLSRHQPGSAPYIYGELQRLTALCDRNNATEEEREDAQSKIKELYLQNEQSPYSVEVLDKLFEVNWHNEGAEEYYLMAKDAVRKFPEYERIELLENKISRYEQQTINLTIGTKQLSNDSIPVTILSKFIDDVTVKAYRISDDADLDSVKEQQLEKQKPACEATFHLNRTLKEEEQKVMFPPLPLGRYVLIAEFKDSQGKTVNTLQPYSLTTIRVTDTDLFLYVNHNGEQRLYAVDARTSQPLAGATIEGRVNSYAETAWRKTVNEKGYVVLDQDDRRYYARIVNGNDSSEWEFLSKIYNYDAQARNSARFYTDLAVYRPGDTMKFAAVVFHTDKEDAAVVKEKTVTVLLYDRNGQLVKEQDFITDAFGRINGEYTLPETGILGSYNLQLKCGSETLAYHSIEVSEYKAPTFFVEIDEKESKLNDKAALSLRGRAMNYTMMPAADATVSYEISQCDVWWFNRDGRFKPLSGTVKTDKDGQWVIPIPEEQLTGTSVYVNARITVTDARGESQEINRTVKLGGNLYIECDRQFTLNADEDSNIAVAVKDNLGNRQEAEIDYRILKGEDVVTSGSFTTRQPQLALASVPSGKYRLEFQIKGETESSQSELLLYRLTDEMPPYETALWLPMKEKSVQCKADGSFELTYGSSYANSVYYIIYNNEKVVSDGWVHTTAGMNKIADKAEFTKKGDAQLYLFTMSDHDMSTEVVTLKPAEPRDEIELVTETFRDNVTPGARETWKLRIRNNNGKPFTSAVIANMYDASLNAIASNLYFGDFYQYHSSLAYRLFFRGGTGLYGSSELTSKDVMPVQLPMLPTLQRFSQMYGVARSANKVYMAAATASNDGAVLEEAVVGKVAGTEVMDVSDSLAEPEVESATTQDAGTDGAQDVKLRDDRQKTAFFLPGLVSTEDGEITFSFDVPDRNTQWQFSAVAYTEDMLSTAINRTVTAAKKYMIEPNMPRFVREGDTVVLKAAALNNTAESITASVHFEITADGKTESKTFDNINISAMGQVIVEMPYEVTASCGEQLICKVVISTPNGNDGEQNLIAILPATTQVIEAEPFYLDEKDKKVKLDTPEFNKNGKITLEYTDNPTWNVVTSIPTMLSKSKTAPCLAANYYATVIAGRLVADNPKIGEAIDYWSKHDPQKSPMEKNAELKTKQLNETPWMRAAQRETESMAQLAEIADPATVQYRQYQALTELADLQLPDGGFSWYKGLEGSAYVTTDVLRYFAHLSVLGYLDRSDALVSRIINRAVEFTDKFYIEQLLKYPNEAIVPMDYFYVRHLLNTTQLPVELTDAYNKAIDTAVKHWGDYDIIGKSRTAMFLSDNGHKKEAASILESIRQYAVSTPTGGMYWEEGGTITATYALLAAHRIDPRNPMVDSIRRYLLMQKETQTWNVSLPIVNDIVYALLETGKDWIGKDGGKPEIKVNGKAIKTDDATPYFGYVKREIELKEGKNTIEVSRSGGSPAWGAVYSQYQMPMADVEKYSADYIRIDKQFFAYQPDGTLADHPSTTFKTGDRIQVRIAIRTERDLDFVAVTDDRASCFEPLQQLSGYSWGETISYREMRDDATNFFIPGIRKGTYVITYDVYANNAGTCASGMTTVQCQYAPQITAHTAGTDVTVE